MVENLDKDSTNAKPFAYTHNQRRKFHAAADRLCGKRCKDDWWTIGSIYAMGARAALEETGETCRTSKIYQNRFSEIIKELDPIAENEATADRYRKALLRIHLNDGGRYDRFDFWYEQTQPRANVPTLLEGKFLDWLREQEPKAPEAEPDTGEEEQVGTKERLEEALAAALEQVESQRGTAGDIQAALNYLRDWTAEQIEDLIPVLQERTKALRESQDSKEPADVAV